MSTGLRDLDPYDAVVLLSFGGPQGPEDVIPFLENVTAGRGIPRERLAEVGEHYHLFNGVSPINAQNSALTTALRTELARRGIATPVYLGNRNWRPSLVDALRQAGADGARRILAVTTSAYSSYSGCRQYREDVATAIAELATEGTVVQVDQVRRYFNIPGFVQANVDAATRAWYEVLDDPADLLDIAGEDWPRLVFVTHSIPIGMQETSGPGGGQYVRQHLSLADRIADLLAEHFGRPIDYDLVFCSRSGPPQVPWLEPDVNDHLQDLAQQGQRRVVLAPIGFISDHMEVAYDLDVEARA
ncbi:MAG: ferrochelatase, partial [Micrococcales bacterium]